MVGADLMAQSTRPAVDHHADLTGPQPEHARDRLVEDRVHRLDLEEVVPRPQAPHLPEAACPSARAHLIRVGVGKGAAVLAPVEISIGAEPALHREPSPLEHQMG